MLKGLSLAVALSIGLVAVFATIVNPGSPWFWALRAVGVALIGVQGLLANLAIRSAKRARASFELLMYDVLGPLARELSLLSRMKPSELNQSLGRTLAMCVAASAALVGADRARCTLYNRGVDADGRDCFQPWLSQGRGDPAKVVFVRGGNRQSRSVWALAERDDAYLCLDIQRDPPPGWQPDPRRDYRTFITVPVRSGDDLQGLMTINAPQPGDLSLEDLKILRVIASLVGTALGMANCKWPPPRGWAVSSDDLTTH